MFKERVTAAWWATAKRAAKLERKSASEEGARVREERMAALALHKEREQKRIANEVKVGEKVLEDRRAAEDAFRRQWLQGVLQDYDVDGKASTTNAFVRERKRSKRKLDSSKLEL